ncbi:zinc finger CCCH domain-containing protein 13-like [Pomacea canaliculata]|uniref:zinc finger CCCH domain-containing protein 13-like n=1 Tax=Pomacea canaliculata TaxID=400727 RepID=UPI000D72649A|nr:zinc finger CCCH domain-containing protein 13-like [Pomacea canaliculata]
MVAVGSLELVTMDKKFCLTRSEKRKELKEAGVERGLVGKDLWQYIDRELDKWWEEKKEERDRVEREREREYAEREREYAEREREYVEREKERERRRAERERVYAEREKERERRRAERERQLEEREKELVMRQFIEMLEEICEEKGKTEEESRKFIEYNLKGCRWGTIAEEREEKARVKEVERVARERARERVKSQKAKKEKKERTKREKEQEFLREVCRLGGVSLDDSDPAEAGNYRSERGVAPAVGCSRCGGAGHDPRSCPQQSDRLRRSVGVKCYSCGVVGHYSRSCPRGYELRKAVTPRGEKLASEVDASNAYASDRSATDVQVSDVGPGDAVTSGAYTSGRKAADVKVNEVNPSKEEARRVETGEQASGRRGFPRCGDYP